MQTTEKIEILFQRIKLATRPAAHIYGNVLCQLTHDLVPPKEVLTKVIKEFLTVSQPHSEVIASVLFQVNKDALKRSFPYDCDDVVLLISSISGIPIGY